MFRRFLAKVCRVLLDTVHTLAQEIEKGGVPSQATSVEDTIAWGKGWIAATIAAWITGETVAVSRIDLTMLALFIASVVVARRSRPRPLIVYQAT